MTALPLDAAPSVTARRVERRVSVGSLVHRARPRGLFWWFAPSFALYVAVGWLLAYHYGSFNGDAQARVANAYYVIFSRDPHLAAVGFVWNPLPSLSVLPLLMLSPVWHGLAERAFAGNVMSAVFMAGAVVEVRRILSECGVRRSVAIVLAGLFAVHPMIVYSGGNGMTEALFLFTLLACTRQLMRYLAAGDTSSLVKAGAWLAVAYYARNEAAAAIGFGAAVVALTAFVRHAGARRERVRAAVTDAVVFGLPPLFAFVSWAAASWLIVGHPFEQFSSQYGTASQLKAMEMVGFKLGTPAAAVQLALAMAPLALVAGAWSVARARKARDQRVFAALAILGSVLAFAVVAYATGQTAGWFRYFITAVPLTVVLAGLAVGDTAPRRSRTVVAVVASLVIAGSSVASAGASMVNPRIGAEEHEHLGFIFGLPLTTVERNEVERFPRSVQMARFIDSLRLPDDSVIVDTFDPCVPTMITASRHAKQFIITNDRDFKPILADPATFHARYLLVPQANDAFGALDAVNRAYPTLFDTGAGIATKRHEFTGAGCPTFRLYAVTPTEAS